MNKCVTTEREQDRNTNVSTSLNYTFNCVPMQIQKSMRGGVWFEISFRQPSEISAYTTGKYLFFCKAAQNPARASKAAGPFR
jgi:hypothetical protein